MAKVNKSKAVKGKKPVAAKPVPSKKSAPAAKVSASAAKVSAPAAKSVAKMQTPVVKAKAAPVAKPTPATSMKVTVQGKTAFKVSPPVSKLPVRAPLKVGKAPEIEKATIVAPAQHKKNEKLDFTAGDFVVYPAHGVGFVEGVETQMIAGMEITLYTICFEKDRMRLKLPVSKVKSSGLRKLSSKDRLKDALATLQGKSQVRRIMWSRRAQEYEMKINSGDPVAIAEVLRDLKREGDQGEQSYSERQIYQAALERLAREVAAIEKIDEKKAAEKLEAVLGNVA